MLIVILRYLLCNLISLVLIVVLTCISLIISGIEHFHFFIFHWPPVFLLWRNVSLDLLPIYFLVGLFVVLILSYMSRRRGRGRDGWMASPTWWTWVWVNSGSWWWTRRPGVLQFMGSQRVGHDWVTELNWTELFVYFNWKLIPCQSYGLQIFSYSL